ncbi:MAG: hypothetical protein LUH02_11120, partial [Erysipelotrichaceae bacterium]|nr:hypothetical protein [Erysipelotrichaceae bacterium]
PYFQDLLEIYFQCVETLNIDLSDALVNIVKYRDQVIYKYYEIKNLIGQNKIEEANLIYRRIKQKNNPWMIKIKEELDTYKTNLEDIMDDTLRAINKKKKLKDIKELIDIFKKKCGKEWNQYKEPFLNQLSQVTTDDHYVAILQSEKAWYLATKKTMYMENMDAFNKYSEILWQNNRETYYLLFMYCLENEIRHTRNGYYDYVVEYLKNLMIIRDVDKDIVINMVYDLQEHFTTRKALIRTLDEFMEEDLS